MNQCRWAALRQGRSSMKQGGGMWKPGTPLRLVWAALAAMLLVTAGYAQQPARTTVSDTVYRADGSAASGTMLISWPAFTTADAKPVAAGTLSVAVGPGGAISVALAPNAGANPDGTFYKVVLKLDDGTTETETWVIPSSPSPVTIAAVRATVVPSSVALQVASRQYVDNAVAAKASDAGVVHIAGPETIAGTKQFATPPSVPAPQQAADAANKAYVDQAVSTVGAGSFVARAGDVMSGPLSLSGDTANAGSLVAPSVVLFDGLLSNVPEACTYALVNSASMHCSIAFTRILRISDVLVRSALPGSGYRTRLTGSQIDGAECSISTAGALQFFAAYGPAPNEQIVASYRSTGRAVVRVINPASIASLQNGSDDGTRGTVVTLKLPVPRTSTDCLNAASALLDDRTQTGWAGEYNTWSSFLPGGAQDIFPGDGLQVNVPSQGAQFTAVVREVLVEIIDLVNDLGKYKIRFANEAAEPLAFQFESNAQHALPNTIAVAQGVTVTLPTDLVAAEITQVSSTTTTIDAGQGVPAGYGVEVRRTDSGWGPDNDRNLVGRFATQGFVVPRLAKRQDYFLRLFDASVPPLYSRHSALLHIDYPF